MQKLNYESPELDIRWFESEEVIAYSIIDVVPGGGSDVDNDDEW